MRLYLGPSSSIELARYLRAVNGESGLEGEPVRKRTFNDAINTTRAVDELDATAQFLLSHVGEPIHAFVGNRAKGTRTKRLVTHVIGRDIPHGAFLDISHGIALCSPRFAFMQLAATLDLVDAIQLGMELCGTYCLWSPATEFCPELQSQDVRNDEDCCYDIPPVMRASRAKEFAERLQGWRGAEHALRALRWVLDGSASPKETAVYLLLCLPKRLGGYGLPQPVLNPQLQISNPDCAKERHPDLFWSGVNIDVEYNSDLGHSGDFSRYKDSKREIELTVANVRVLPLTRRQLMNVDEFDAFAQGLRRMLGVRSRVADSSWFARRGRLRRRLLLKGEAQSGWRPTR